MWGYEKFIKGIYNFYDSFIGNVPIKINNNLFDNEIKFNREKNNKCTEYEPYNNLGDNDCEWRNKRIYLI